MIELRTLSRSDVFSFYKWINDEEVIKYSLSLFSRINSEREIESWFLTLINDKKNINLGIVLKSTNKLIGYAGICDVSKTNKSGEYFIFIGDKELWGKGIGEMVTREILNIGFSEYSLNRIMLTVYEQNIGGLKAYEKAGFRTEGKLREVAFRENKFHNKVIMSVLKSEWEEKLNPTQ